jgi:hypothetical protein
MDPSYEKLGAFYLGRGVSAESGEISAEPLLYDSKDLTTHAVCVGMTGSGKTGLCVSLLEEAAIDRIPALLIDPKGDLGNLMLTFPDLSPEQFRPWIDESEALRKGMTANEFARNRAELWRKGLASWGQDGERIRRLREAADVAIYTPGGGAGIPLRVLRSFAAPPEAVRTDAGAMRERVAAATSGLLVLLGVDADPVRSREHILISNILDRVWRAGQDLDLPGLIRQIQQPPFETVGVFAVDTFYPAKERFELAMTVNNVLASPGFAPWMEGEPLDINRLLYTPQGKPRLAILSIAHLNDSERMFFVTLLLTELVSWMRSQPGTGSLRALLYMDEVFGYLPPTANPPSKIPLLTLLKQARAYGLGVLLATQNPVDLDYKALSNAGTWFLGRLQTERDKMRVLDGLEGASAATGVAFDRAKMEARLSGLKSRVFLMNNVHEDAPVLFHTRWALSYLRGPLTHAQIARLMQEKRQASRPDAAVGTAASSTPTSPAAPRALPPAPGTASASASAAAPAPDAGRPILPPGIPQLFLQPTTAATGTRLYRPALLGHVRLHYVKSPAAVDDWRDAVLLAPLPDTPGGPIWADAERIARAETSGEPDLPARFAVLPAAARSKRSYRSWGKMLISHAYRETPLRLHRCRSPKAWSRPGESEAEFRARLALLLRERRDLALEKLKRRYGTKFTRLEERIRKAEQRVEREEAQHGQQKLSATVAIGATILGAIFGRKALSTTTISKAGTAMRSAGKVGREKEDIARARATVAANRERLEALEAEFRTEVDELNDSVDAEFLDLEEVVIHPRKGDMAAQPVTLVWTPWRVHADGTVTPDYGG